MGNCAGILLKYKNPCLLCNRSQGGSLPGVWSVPGGHLEKGESIESGAIKEFREETGIQILGDLDYITYLDVPNSRKKFYLFMYDVKYKVLPDLDMAKDGFEHEECKWFTKKTLPNNVEKQLFFVINKIF
jgi:ADP-ribose pyrophosphatase YjhB (NUDIX family)